jgi:hypothetical protein
MRRVHFQDIVVGFNSCCFVSSQVSALDLLITAAMELVSFSKSVKSVEQFQNNVRQT